MRYNPFTFNFNPVEIYMGTELETVNNEFSIDIADDTASLLAALGQDDTSQAKAPSLSSLRINYDADTDDGETLKRGTWKICTLMRFSSTQCCERTSGLSTTKKKVRLLVALFSVRKFKMLSLITQAA